MLIGRLFVEARAWPSRDALEFRPCLPRAPVPAKPSTSPDRTWLPVGSLDSARPSPPPSQLLSTREMACSGLGDARPLRFPSAHALAAYRTRPTCTVHTGDTDTLKTMLTTPLLSTK
jgi:hypothetical protein